jgi:hypothetical protein
MKLHLQDSDVPVVEIMQLHITATNEGIGFLRRWYIFLQPSALMVTYSAICSQLLAMLGLDSVPHLLYACFFIYIMIHYLKAATEQQLLILYLDNPVILP